MQVRRNTHHSFGAITFLNSKPRVFQDAVAGANEAFQPFLKSHRPGVPEMEWAYRGLIGDMHQLNPRVMVLRQGQCVWHAVQGTRCVVSHVDNSLKAAVRQLCLGDPRTYNQGGTRHISEDLVDCRVQPRGTRILNLRTKDN
jgi:hypothetical protein